MTQPDLPIVEPERLPVAPTPDALLELAIAKDLDVAKLEKLIELRERVEATAAAREFFDAFARFQAKLKPIEKNKLAPKTTTKSGAQYGGYYYATLDEIARTVSEPLAEEGLSYSWDTWFSEDGRRLRVTCTLRHRAGHSISSAFEAPTEAVTQAMSPQQKTANAQTYGRRYSLVAVLGITTADPDLDGGPPEEEGPKITPEQADVLLTLLDERPAGALQRFLDHFEIAQLIELPASAYDRCVADLKAKIAKGAS